MNRLDTLRLLSEIPNTAERFPGVTWTRGAETTIFISPEATIGADTHIKPFVVMEGDTCVGKRCKITTGAILIDSRCGDDCVIGAEIKRSVLGNRVMAGHGSSYLGDTEVGDGTNIAAGVITANYDGKNKKKTVIGKDSFIGIGVELIAPLTIGSNVFIAAGIIIRDDVPDNTFVDKNGKHRPNKMKKVGSDWIRQEPA